MCVIHNVVFMEIIFSRRVAYISQKYVGPLSHEAYSYFFDISLSKIPCHKKLVLARTLHLYLRHLPILMTCSHYMEFHIVTDTGKRKFDMSSGVARAPPPHKESAPPHMKFRKTLICTDTVR